MMDITTLITLALIGIVAGIASGYIGIGGGIIIIPALIYFLKLDQYQAQGISLALHFQNGHDDQNDSYLLI